MNPNYENAPTETEPDTQDPTESGENEMSFSTAEYPELEGLQPGNPIKVTCQGTVANSDDGQISITIDPGSCQFETEGQADKEMKNMSKQESISPAPTQGQGEDF